MRGSRSAVGLSNPSLRTQSQENVSAPELDDEEVPSSSERRSLKNYTMIANKEYDEEAPSTIPTEPTVAQSTDEDGNKDKVTVNHNFNAQPRGLQRICGMSRPMLAVASILVMIAGAVGFWTWYKIPPLNSQVRDLQNQVNRLSQQVNLLEAENQRFAANNAALNSSIAFFQQQNVMLNETSGRLKQSVVDLGANIVQLTGVTADLRNTTKAIAAQNNGLNSSYQQLLFNVQTVNASVMDLKGKGDTLQSIQASFQANLTSLDRQNSVLNATKQRLDVLMNATVATSNDLNQSLTNLSGVSSYLNSSIRGTDDQLRQSINNMTVTIAKARYLGMENLNINYLATLKNWDCPMADRYPFQFRNLNTIINKTVLQLMLADMTTATGLVTNLCLNNANYQAFLDYSYDIKTPKMTTQQFVDGTNAYGKSAIAYMFPSNPAQGGLTNAQWEAAQYKCDNITKYQWIQPTSRRQMKTRNFWFGSFHEFSYN